MDRKSFNFEIKSLHTDEEYFHIEGKAAVFGTPDSFGDIITKGAFANSIASQRDFALLWQHDSSSPIGIIDSVLENDSELLMRARLPLSDVFVRERVVPQVTIGSVKSLSIGFVTVKSDREGGNRFLNEIDLKEISLVTSGAHKDATIQAFKNASPYKNLPLTSLDREWVASEAIVRVRAFTNSEEAPSATYKEGFFYYDPAAADEFGGYKFPFVDIINGEMQAVPRAINNASSRLDNSDIPSSDKDRIRINIDRYREKMENESNNSESEKDYELKSYKSVQVMSFKELKCSLMGGTAFSKQAASFIASTVISNINENIQNKGLNELDRLDYINKKADTMVTATKRA